MGSPRRPEPASGDGPGQEEARTQEDRQTDGPARPAESRGRGQCLAAPPRRPQVPQPWDPEETNIRASGWWGCHPGHSPVGGACGAQNLFPQTPQAFPQPSLRGEPPATPHTPPLPRAWRGTAASVCPGATRQGRGGGTPLPQLQAEGGLQGVHGSPPSSKRVMGPGEAEGPAGQLRACLGQGGEAPWGRWGGPVFQGCWTPGALEGGLGSGTSCAQRSRWATSPRPGPPVGHRGL